MKARDIMTRKVRTVTLATPVASIARTLISRRISAVPVVDRKQHVLGIVSEGDLLRRVESGTERRRSWWTDLVTNSNVRSRDYVKSHGRRARDVMTRPVISVTETTDVADIADLMERWDIKRVSVVRRDRLVGIVSRQDLLQALSRAKAGRRKRAGDGYIRDQLRDAIESMVWLPTTLVNFVVEKGVISLHGIVGSDAQRQAIRVLAENIPGVRAVKNELSVLRPSQYGL